MCGVNLVLRFSADAGACQGALAAMDRAIAHRGPDAGGTVVRTIGGWSVGLGHRRLSIIDVSDAANQPMVSPDGALALVFNGEIYNYPELRRELGGHPAFERSQGDTATLLAALDAWGPAALGRCNGMWAFALLDTRRRRVLIARDRLGKKPLYFHHDRVTGALTVSSEVKGVLAGSGARLPLDPHAARRFMLQSVTDDCERTFFEGIASLPAASWAEIDLSGSPGAGLSPVAYWRHPRERGLPQRPGAVSPVEVRDLLQDAVRIRLRSDVPVGILLSGGLDSSALIGLARRADPACALTAFSVVSDDPKESEEPFIRRMAAHARVRLRVINVDRSPGSFLDELEEANWYNDQPLTSLSMVAHRRLMRRAADEGFKVLLTGQGSDEQLGGYNKFLYYHLLHLVRAGRVLGAGRCALEFLVRGTVFREFSLQEASRYLPWLRRPSPGWAGERLLAGAPAPTGPGASYAEAELADMVRFSLPQLLHTEDRMAMSAGIEMRVPFVDYRVVELLAAVPPGEKLRSGWTKHVLRRAMAGVIPDAIRFRRDKKGFNIPQERWLRGPLAARARTLLAGAPEIERHGVIAPGQASVLLESFLAGAPWPTYKLVFGMVSLELWLRRFAPWLAP